MLVIHNKVLTAKQKGFAMINQQNLAEQRSYAKKTHPIQFSGGMSSMKLQVFYHHLYEFKKGLRNLVLTTESIDSKKAIEDRLFRDGIACVIHEIGSNKINVFFGNKSCIDVVSTFNPRLNKLTPEQDFMLGIMLGYDRLKQCDRYLKIKSNGMLKDTLIG